MPAIDSYPFTDPHIALKRGKVQGSTPYDIYGINADVTAAEDIWNTGGTYAAPATAAVVNVASGSANDDGSPAGTGAQTIRLYGVDSNYDLATEDIVLNGTSNVASTTSWWHIHKMRVLTVGSGGTNAGAITATSAAAGTPVLCSIAASAGQSRSTVFLVPRNATAYLTYIHAGYSNNTGGNTANIELLIKPFGGPSIAEDELALSDSNNSDRNPFVGALVAEAKSLIKLRCRAVTGGSAYIHGMIGLVLVEGA